MKDACLLQTKRATDCGVFHGVRQKRMSEKRAEPAIFGKVSQFGIVHNNCARYRLACGGIDDRLQRFFRVRGDHFCELEPRLGGERVEHIHDSIGYGTGK